MLRATDHFSKMNVKKLLGMTEVPSNLLCYFGNLLSFLYLPN